MRKFHLCLITGLVFGVICFTKCSDNKQAGTQSASTADVEKSNFGGYENQVDWGKHLVTIGGCNDCHTPKKMTPMGPVDDSTLLLSGHPEKMPAPDVDRKQMESKGLIVTSTFTAWIGPWGITYAANLNLTKQVQAIGQKISSFTLRKIVSAKDLLGLDHCCHLCR